MIISPLLLLLNIIRTVSSIPVRPPNCVLDLTQTFNNHTLYFPGLKPFVDVKWYRSLSKWPFPIQIDDISESGNVGTHIEAPRHFVSHGLTVDNIPLTSLISVPVAVIHITKEAVANRDYEMTIGDLQEWEKKVGTKLNNMWVFMRTGWSKFWPDREAFIGNPNANLTGMHFPGISHKAAVWLRDERKIIGLGTEALSIDPGTNIGTIFSSIAHRILLKAGKLTLQSLSNGIKKLPIYGAKLIISPMKIGDAGASPTRVFAYYLKHPNRPC